MVYSIYTDGISQDKVNMCGSAYMVFCENKFIFKDIFNFQSNLIVEAETLAILEAINSVLNKCKCVTSIIVHTDSKCARENVEKQLLKDDIIENIDRKQLKPVQRRIQDNIKQIRKKMKENDIVVSIKKIQAHTGRLNANNAVDRYVRYVTQYVPKISM